MNPLKKQYLDRIRSESAYPAFRRLVGMIALLLYFSGGVIILLSVVLGLSMKNWTGGQGDPFVLFGGSFFGLAYILLAKVMREACLVLADLSDSVTDLNSRY